MKIPKRLADRRDDLCPNYVNATSPGIVTDYSAVTAWQHGFDAAITLLLESSELKGLVLALDFSRDVDLRNPDEATKVLIDWYNLVGEDKSPEYLAEGKDE